MHKPNASASQAAALRNLQHRKARVYLEALPILASVMCESAGVELLFEPDATTGCTDGRNIILPSPPVLAEEAPHADVARLATLYGGLLDHEIGHCRKSDLPSLSAREIAEKRSPLFHGLLNAIEDPRMESEHGQDYPGADRNMRELSMLLVNERKDTAVTAQVPPGAMVTAWVCHMLRADLRDEEVYIPLAEEDERVVRTALGDKVADRIKATIVSGSRNMQSPDDAYKLSGRLAAIIKEEADAPPPPAQQPQPNEQEEPGDPQADPQAPAAPKDAPGNPEEPQTTPEQHAALQELLQSTPQDVIPDRGQTVSQMLSEGIEKLIDAGLADPSVLQGNAPSMGTPTEIEAAEPSSESLAPIDQQLVRGETARLRTRLAHLLQAETMESERLARRGTRIDTRVLHRPLLGDPRIFIQREEGRSVDTAMFLLIDDSGSMDSYGRIEMARYSTLATAVAADVLPDVVCAVGSFPGYCMIQRFGQKARVRAPSFGIPADGQHTPLDKGLLWAGKHLSTRTETRRVLIVATDGIPNDETAARQAIYALEALGIEVYGLGMDIDISHIFDRSKALPKIEALTGVLFDILETTIRRQLAA